ncbi:MAG TPA: sigma-70 family RNA polymerase sigma factor [Gemmatimonadaceae bacterium]
MNAQTRVGSGQDSRSRWWQPAESGRVDSPHDITGLLIAWRSGDRGAFDRLFSLVYEELRGIAHRGLARERLDHTLGTTALVNEAYLKLVDQTRAQWTDRVHFFAVAASAMRRILVDYARRHQALKRGGAPTQLSLDDAQVANTTMIVAGERAETMLALNDALVELAELDERMARVVECRFFGGLTDEETAEALGISPRTVRREWVKAKGWLHQRLRE